MKARKHSDFIYAFIIAVLVHGAIGYCAGTVFFSQKTIIDPLFRAGLSSVELTLVAPIFETVEVEVEPSVIEEPLEQAPLIEPKEVEPDPVVAEKIDADLQEKGVESAPASTAQIRPQYPYGSRIRGEEGVVVLKALLNHSGRPTDVSVVNSSGFQSLDRAAIKAMKKAVFLFASGAPVSGEEVEYTFRFQLKE